MNQNLSGNKIQEDISIIKNQLMRDNTSDDKSRQMQSAMQMKHQ